MSTPAIAEQYRMTVAEEVRVHLARRRMSGVKLAQLINRSQVYVSRRLRGEVPFDIDDLALIAVVLGVSVSDLLPPSTRASSPTLVDPLAQRVIATVGAPKRRRTQPHTPIRGNRPSPVRVRPLTPAPA